MTVSWWCLIFRLKKQHRGRHNEREQTDKDRQTNRVKHRAEPTDACTTITRALHFSEERAVEFMGDQTKSVLILEKNRLSFNQSMDQCNHQPITETATSTSVVFSHRL